MAVDFRDEAPAILKDYLIYKQTIKNMSKKTVDEYFIDLRTFFRFLKVMRGLVPDGTEFDEIKIDDVDLDLIKTVNLELAYDYMNFLYRDRNNKSESRARKCFCLFVLVYLHTFAAVIVLYSYFCEFSLLYRGGLLYRGMLFQYFIQ